jgi:4'-phosphopantetheinyl transferase
MLLPDDEVHVWWVDLDSRSVLGDPTRILCPVERARAARFVFPRDRRRYSVSHWALRSILARYLAADPSNVPLSQPPSAKPRLDGPSDLRFNLSHSGERAVVGVARGRELGIDLEQHRDLDDLEGLAERCFAPSELATWRTLSGATRTAAFFTTWTRKEAYLKALGDGLARPLDSFDVTVGENEGPRLVRDAEDPSAPARWSFLDLDPGPGFAATLAVDGVLARLVAFTLTPEENHGSRGAGGGRTAHGRGEPGATVLPVAGRQAPAQGLERRGTYGHARGMPGLHQGGLDRHAAGEPAFTRERFDDIRLTIVGGRA